MFWSIPIPIQIVSNNKATFSGKVEVDRPSALGLLGGGKWGQGNKGGDGSKKTSTYTKKKRKSLEIKKLWVHLGRVVANIYV